MSENIGHAPEKSRVHTLCRKAAQCLVLAGHYREADVHIQLRREIIRKRPIAVDLLENALFRHTPEVKGLPLLLRSGSPGPFFVAPGNDHAAQQDQSRNKKGSSPC